MHSHCMKEKKEKTREKEGGKKRREGGRRKKEKEGAKCFDNPPIQEIHLAYQQRHYCPGSCRGFLCL